MTHLQPPRFRYPRLAALLAISAAFSSLLGASHDSRVSSYVDASTCTRCHRSAATDLMATTHWTWEHPDAPSGKLLGKRHVINNYCIAVPSNEPRCTSCHVGVGYRDQSFDFTDTTKVDCLVCHDTTGTYKKFPTLAGAPWTGPGTTNFGGAVWEPVDLTHVAKKVGRTSRATCGACHFYGGGGDAVKHGDLDSSLLNPVRSLDVHMGTDGMNFQCTDCHEPARHEIPGSSYAKTDLDHETCQKCHSSSPHAAGSTGDRLNTHARRVACQTCHIPEFARGRTTKMSWDWSTAGVKGLDGKNQVLKNDRGDTIYDTQKGTFTWESDVRPEYLWFNGGVSYLTVEDSIDPTGIVSINRMHGSLADTNSFIYPVKRFTGAQPYDVGRGTLVVPHLFGSDTNAYWKSFDWQTALDAGMAYLGLEFSGQLGWVSTEMFWIQNHMVAPKEQALTCADCHVPQGRLDFAALGYDAARAAMLQTLAGFTIEDLAVMPDSGGVEIQWTAAPASSYQIQSSSDLLSWTDIPGALVVSGDEGGQLRWQDSTPADDLRFYRIVRNAP